jgi:hypothetical protein
MKALVTALVLAFSSVAFAQAPATPAAAPKESKAKKKVDDVPAKKPVAKKTDAKKADTKAAPAKK